MTKRKELSFLIGLIIVLFFVNYPFLDKALNNYLNEDETGIVQRAIDGDTIVINGTSIRMLGINTPEKGEVGYSEAKVFLSNLLTNKSVKLEFGKDKIDKYGRKLAYVIFNGKNINQEMIERGFANPYFPSGKDKYSQIFYSTWNECLNKNINLCEKTKNICASCLFITTPNPDNQSLTIKNNCGFDCNLTNWTIKDEGRKKFIFGNIIINTNSEINIVVGDKTNTKNTLYWKNQTYVWTSTGDSIFVRDKDNRLVYYNYLPK